MHSTRVLLYKVSHIFPTFTDQPKMPTRFPQQAHWIILDQPFRLHSAQVIQNLVNLPSGIGQKSKKGKLTNVLKMDCFQLIHSHLVEDQRVPCNLRDPVPYMSQQNLQEIACH